MYGMTEEQFWNSNPRIIKVWEQAYKNEQNRMNNLIYNWVGNYGVSALMFAIDHCLNGRKAKAKYLEQPIQIFELTEEEKEKATQKARQNFLAWAENMQRKFDKEGG
jgi:hypothetical protein